MDPYALDAAARCARVVIEEMTDLPEPLVTIEVDLRDFSFLPIDITRLFDSEFHARANDAEWRAGITLWLKSFHQVPAASLPDDDVLLTRLSEHGRDIDSWKAVRKMALWGWVKCSDGRLYHPVVAEKAMEAYKKKQSSSIRGKIGNEKRWGKKQPMAEGSPKDHLAIAEGSLDDKKFFAQGSQGTGTGTGTGTGNIKNYDANASLSADIDASADSAVQTAENKPGEPENTGTNDKTPPCPHQKIIDLYHKHLAPFCPKVRIWEGQRPKKLLTLWKQNPDLEWWDGFFAYCAESKFLTGRSPPRQGAPPFVATMEWLISPTNFQKIYEGMYHRG
jgi:hypothetical protein